MADADSANYLDASDSSSDAIFKCFGDLHRSRFLERSQMPPVDVTGAIELVEEIVACRSYLVIRPTVSFYRNAISRSAISIRWG